MTLNEIVFELAEKTARPDDVAVIRQIRQAVLTWRAEIIRQMGSKRYLNDQLFQRFCLPMTKASAAECCDVSTDCTVYKTEQTVPYRVGFRDVPNHYVGKIGGSASYVWIADMVYLAGVLSRRYGSKTFYYWQVGGHIYTNARYGKILLKAIFDDPSKASNLYNCESDPCFSDDSDFPATADVISRIKRAVMENEIRGILNTKDEQIHVDDDEQPRIGRPSRQGRR